MKKSAEYSLIFSVGAVLYSLIEVIFRGYTHWTMALTGGFLVLILYIIDNKLINASIFFRCALGCIIITGVEFVVGCIVNLWLRMDVWDYSDLPFNLLGQICLYFSSVWFLLSFFAIFVFKFIRKNMIKRAESNRYENQLEEI